MAPNKIRHSLSDDEVENEEFKCDLCQKQYNSDRIAVHKLREHKEHLDSNDIHALMFGPKISLVDTFAGKNAMNASPVGIYTLVQTLWRVI